MNNAKRVLIFRHGSLGDTIVALPCFHLIARAFPDAERRLLTTIFPSDKVVAPSAVLENTGLVHGYFSYDARRWHITQLVRLRNEFREWKPDVLIYLAEPRSFAGTWRDALFFKSCGIKELIGVPYTKALRENRWLVERRRFEHESERLARCLKDLGDARIHDEASWDLRLTNEENEAAARCLEGWAGREQFIVATIAAKVRAKDWGSENWSKLLERLNRFYPRLGLALVGAEAEAEYSGKVARGWKGPLLNLCGRLNLRESVAVMKHAIFYLGHDSGPMHLASAMGVSCVALFVRASKPGVWFPYGNDHQVIHHQKNGRQTAPITVDEVFKVTQKMIEKESVKQ